MVTPVEKRSSNKFCDFHDDKGHNTDECMQLKKQIEELVRAGKLSHLIKTLEGEESTKVGKKEVVVTGHNSGTEGPLVIEVEIGGHMIHRMYVDGGSSTEEIPKEAGVRHENFKVALHSNFPDQEVAIGGTLSAKGQTELCSLLKENLDIFAWQPSDITGVPRSIAEHRLNIWEGYSPVRQKKRGQASKRTKSIQTEKLTGKLNLSAATPLSVSWTLTKAITRYIWQSQMKRKWLSTPAMGYIVIPKWPSASRTQVPRTSGWWTKLLTAKMAKT
ncbi:hypothetical protein Tco_0893208 [Tanacetum coccineum]|uniref:Reverse transcriptase domain-containing protein n=1 Tax=Tanacetum coccineum TaxID=301880 RepID=A0ABQ5C859_9ASTR